MLAEPARDGRRWRMVSPPNKDRRYAVSIGEAPRLISAIEPQNIARLRDRAIIGILGDTQTSIDSVIAMQVRDYYAIGNRRWLRLHENSGERHELAGWLEPHINAYLAAAGIANEPETPLFRSTLHGKPNHPTKWRFSRTSVLSLIKTAREQLKSEKYTNIVMAPNPFDDADTIESAMSKDLLNRHFDKLIENIQGNNPTSIRDRAILGLMLYASLSPEIISSMCVVNGQPCIPHSAANLGRVAIVPSPPLAMLLRDYLKAFRLRRNGRKPLFSASSRDGRPMTMAEIQGMVRQRIRQSASPKVAV